MKRHISVISLGLGLLLLVGMSGPFAAVHEVPFKGDLEGTVTVTPGLNGVNVVIEATGNATQLGNFSLHVPHLVDTTTRTGKGTYEFTAANGDRLLATFEGIGTLIAPGVLQLVETANFTGGTGRFANASGSFTSERIFHMAAGTTTGSFEGTISN